MKKYLNIKLIVGLAAVGLVYLFGVMMAPGSYPYAEIYSFDISEDSLVLLIDKVKDENQEIAILETDRIYLTYGAFKDGRRGNEHWYHIYFLNRKTSEVVHTWVRGDKNSTDLAFHGLTNLRTQDFTEINNSWWPWKHSTEIEEFEENILKKIKNAAQHQL